MLAHTASVSVTFIFCNSMKTLDAPQAFLQLLFFCNSMKTLDELTITK